MKRIISAALALCLLLSMAACAGQSSGKIPGGNGDAKTETAQPEKESDDRSNEKTETVRPAKGTDGKSETKKENALPGNADGEKDAFGGEAATDEAAQAALDLLHRCMDGTRQAAAVAYLGYRDAAERDGDLTDWLWTNVPGLMEEMAFLRYIPADRVLNGDYGDLYCVVPRDESTSLAVNHVVWRSNGSGVRPEADEVLFRSEYAQPLLLFVRWEEFQDEPDVEVVIAADGGVEVTWNPVRNVEDGGYIVIPTGEDYETLLLDFSSFGDVTGMDHDGNIWAPPTQTGLSDTVWNCGGWMLELHCGGSDPDYAGTAKLSFQQEDGQEYLPVYSGVWRMESDCLRLELSAGVGTSLSGSFPVYIDLSGEQLMLQRDWATGAGLPFFDDGVNYVTLTLSYG